MTAIEYLRKRDSVADWGHMIETGGALVGTIIIFVVINYFFPKLSTGIGAGLLLTVVSCVTLFAIVHLWYEHWDREFVRSHPEMAGIDEWTRVMGSLDNYPVNSIDELKLTPEIIHKIEGLARCVIAATEIRTQNKKILDEMPAGSPEIPVFQANYQFSCGIADAFVKEYSSTWDLLVVNRKILSGPTYQDPSRYLEIVGTAA